MYTTNKPTVLLAMLFRSFDTKLPELFSVAVLGFFSEREFYLIIPKFGKYFK